MLKILRLRYLLQYFYLNKSGTERVLILFSAFTIGLSLTRVVYTGESMFLWLNWNLFLAFVPFYISRWATRNAERIENNRLFTLLFAAWLLFIPNAFYIITDLFHLQEGTAVPLWFDLALIFSFAWNGLLLGILSVRQMEKIIKRKWRFSEVLFVYPIMFLNALGIYIGRYLRYNSWDVVSSPFQLISDVVYLLVHPVRNRFDWSMILCFSIFMTLLYISMKRISREMGRDESSRQRAVRYRG